VRFMKIHLREQVRVHITQRSLYLSRTFKGGSHMKTMSTLCVFALSALALTSVARADDASAKAKYDQAVTAYQARADLSQNEKAISLLEQAEAEASSDELKYDIYCLQSRAFYYRGQTTPGSEENNPAKVPAFEAGIAAAIEAKNLNDSYADAYYYHALNLGRWGLAKGKMKALFRLGELKDAIAGARALEAKDGSAGEAFDGYGPLRILGRMYWSLPGIAGGDNRKSLSLLKSAFEGAKDYAINVYYYAETLNEFGAQSRAQGCQLLKELLANNPQSYNPKRTPETVTEFEEAAKLAQRMGCN